MAERAANLRAPRILLADDNADTRDMYALHLAISGYEVDVAVDGRQAVQKARKRRPDLVVMDLRMPRLDGWGAIRDLRRHRETAGIPVIVLTGHEFKDYLKSAAFAAGACAFLAKPTLPAELTREIQARLAPHPNPRADGV